MRWFTCLLGLVFVLLVGSPPIGAQEAIPPSEAAAESVDCVDPEFLSNALIECTGLEIVPSLESAVTDAAAGEFEASSAAAATTSGEIVFPRYCRVKVEVVFWTGLDWLRLAEALANDASECAEYYISIPPQDGDKTMLRLRPRFDEVRALNPRIHPVAEINFTARTGWRAWVLDPAHPERSFYGAGVVARRRMEQRGLDVTRGETWALNELPPEVLMDAPGRRAEIREFLRGLYDGEPNMPKARGIVFNVGLPSDVGDATAYKASLQAWLMDEPFWSDLNEYVDFFAQEVYASSLTWGVAGAPRARRAEYLNDFLQHVIILAEQGPASVEVARKFLRRTYVPLANAAWPQPKGAWPYTLISAEAMSQFVSTQVYAVRHYANAHPQTAPQGRIGFAWAPNTRSPAYSPDGSRAILTRLASAIHEASEEGTNSQMGACGPPGEHVWCAGEVEGAFLNEAWKIFGFWG
jgi:hypothetical protein